MDSITTNLKRAGIDMIILQPLTDKYSYQMAQEILTFFFIIPVQTISKTIILTCDANGDISYFR